MTVAPEAGPETVAARLRARAGAVAARARILGGRAREFAIGARERIGPLRLARLGKWRFAAGAALGVGAIAAAALAVRSLPASGAPAPAAAPVVEPIVACTGAAADPTNEIIVGGLHGKTISEVLRGRGVQPEEVYRVRRALELVPGFRAPNAGRFVAAVRAGSGALVSFELVVSPTEVYRAKRDATGNLVGERAHEPPEQRLCAGAMTVRASFNQSLETAPFHHEVAAALDTALGPEFAKEKAEPGTKIRLVAREARALGAFAGYDGVEAVEIVPGGDAKRARRVFRSSEDPNRYLASLDRSSLDPRSRWLDERLDAIPWTGGDLPSAPAPSSSAIAPPEPTESAEPRPRHAPAEPPSNDKTLTLAKAARQSCSTRVVEGLSQQVIAESRCLARDAFVKVPSRSNLQVNGNVFLYLEAPAKDHLLAVLAANPKKTMTVNSALRVLPQQILLSQWGETQRCGVKLAAAPGESNHESGLALDVAHASTWKKDLEKGGFKWLGPSDPVHFDYKGPGAVDHGGLDVKAFQRLWNRNHPDDALPETGHFDAATGARVLRSPAGGFPIGARCGAP